MYDLTSLNAARHHRYGHGYYAGEAAAEVALERKEKAEAKAEARTEKLTRLVVGKGAAFASAGLLGFFQAYKGMPEIVGGVGLDAFGAIALTGLELYQVWKGKSFGALADSAISGAATGFGCFWFASQGNTYGAAKRSKEGGAGTTAGFDYEQPRVAGLPENTSVPYAPPHVGAAHAVANADPFAGYR